MGGIRFKRADGQGSVVSVPEDELAELLTRLDDSPEELDDDYPYAQEAIGVMELGIASVEDVTEPWLISDASAVAIRWALEDMLEGSRRYGGS